MYVRICACAPVCMYVCMHVSMHLCIYVSNVMNVCMYVCTYPGACVFACMYVANYVAFVRVYLCMYTLTHVSMSRCIYRQAHQSKNCVRIGSSTSLESEHRLHNFESLHKAFQIVGLRL